MDKCDTTPEADMLPGPDIDAVRKACRIMGAQLTNFDRFVSHGLHWLSNRHGRIRLEHDSHRWVVEPLNNDGEWTEANAGEGRTIHDAIANAVMNALG